MIYKGPLQASLYRPLPLIDRTDTAFCAPDYTLNNGQRLASHFCTGVAAMAHQYLATDINKSGVSYVIEIGVILGHARVKYWMPL